MKKIHNTRESIDFLRKWSSSDFWVLTSIVPDGQTDTASFAPRDWADAANWIEQRQNKQNIYFHVNPVKAKISKKASKSDIASLGWLHIDIDPRAGEDFEKERARALKSLSDFIPSPTVIVDSGGGYQGFWRLLQSDDLFMSSSNNIAELEAYNIQLEKIFGADNCHNVDRIMRLPGTVNIPNKKKVAKGRVRAPATLVQFSDAVYPISEFTPAVKVQSSSCGITNGLASVEIASGNIADVGVAELQEWAKNSNKHISDHTLALIAGGVDPLDPLKYESRSEVLFKVCCDLVRAGLPDELLFAVITGGNTIAESVRDKPNWESYALRQIQRAKEDAIDPWLRQLNEKHAVIEDVNGRCRIISEVKDEALNRYRISMQSFDDFRNRYCNIKVVVGVNESGKETTKAAGGWWIEHPQRRQYESIVFAPGKDTPKSYNLWKGFACNSLPGNKHNSFLTHLFDNICGGDSLHYNYLISWMARCVQQPDSPGQVAVVLRGGRGTGKSIAARIFGSLFGRHFLQISDSKHLVGSFNAHLRDAVVVFGDEAFFAGDKKHESVLKTIVTEEHIIIEGKGVDAAAAPNYVHLLLASNEDWVVPAGLDERRFFALEVGSGQKQDSAYFGGIVEDMDRGGRETLLRYLMTYDITRFNVREVPQTAALQEQKMLSMGPEEQWLFDKIWEGRLLKYQTHWIELVSKDKLYDDYLRELQNQGRGYRMSRIAFGKFLAKSFPGAYPYASEMQDDYESIGEDGNYLTIKKRCGAYILPMLNEARKFWDEKMGGPFDWPIRQDNQPIQLKPPF